MTISVLELSKNEIAGTAVVDFVYLAIAELIKEGLRTGGEIYYMGEQNALVAHDGINTLGVLMYTDYTSYNQSYHINLSYTAAKYRRQGVNSLLWKHLKRKAATNEVLTITSGILPDNKQSIANAEKRGMKVESLSYAYRVFEGKL